MCLQYILSWINKLYEVCASYFPLHTIYTLKKAFLSVLRSLYLVFEVHVRIIYDPIGFRTYCIWCPTIFLRLIFVIMMIVCK